MNMEILGQVLISLFLAASIFLLIWSVFRFPVPTEPPIHRSMAKAVGLDQRLTIFEQPLLAPIMSIALTAADRLSIKSLRDYTRQQLDASGNPNGYSVSEYLAICLVCMVLLSVVSGVIVLLLIGHIDPITLTVMGAIGFWIPLSSAKGTASARVHRISKQLPYSLDLIALMMGAGGTFTESVQTLIRDNPEEDLNQEMRIVLAEIEFGSKRSEALTHLAERIPLESLRSVIGAVNQAEAMGTPLSQILKNQSDMMRMHRSVRAEKLSASASLRILFPTMLIMISVIFILFGPMIVRYVKDGLF